MNQKQREYALNRVSTLANLQTKKLKEKYTVKPRNPTWHDAITSFFAGDAILRLELSQEHNKFSKCPSEVFHFADGDVKFEHITDEGLKAIAAVESAALHVKDEIMLGDSEAALKSIHNFEALLVASE